MHRFGFWFDVVIKDDERGFLSRDGRFVRLLAPGRFTSFDPGRQLSVEVVKAVRTELTPERALLLHRTHRPVAEQNFEIVQTSPTEVAIVSFDGEAKHLVPPNTTRAFWKALTSVDVELIDTETEDERASIHGKRISEVRVTELRR